ncbi:MAG TPA: GNAT family N-acetyltransferase [Xanthomonadaceae bacterium]|jgi:GNAT superfamily N-acetyltransferase|nr:GNAT family N-acetyltransferase [Xanthomonadaceae bacterium]
MIPHALDNPIWESLVSRHHLLAQRRGDVVRYPAAVAPFLAVASAGMNIGEALESLVPPDDTVYLLGSTPSLPKGWSLRGPTMLAQMICPIRMVEVDGPQIIELCETHRADVLALTALVYPHYFRPRTMEMGRYFGIYCDGRLAAMIGERMGTDDFQEISAVCTDPHYNGRGYARRLLAWLSNDILERGRTPFLHVSKENVRALKLYEQGGYVRRPDIAFWSLRRGEGAG